MSRPLLIEFPGAVYHVTAHGDRREPIFVDEGDRARLLDVVSVAMDRYSASVLTYSLMRNHYHFVLQTSLANLALLMRHINGIYTQAFNRRHGLIGHLFQGRFKAVVVDRDAYLLAVCRYVELNPVRANIVERPEDWPWSSYRAHLGLAAGPAWLSVCQVHALMLGHEPFDSGNSQVAAARYAELVKAGVGVNLWTKLKQQIYLGSEEFIKRMQLLAKPAQLEAIHVPKDQRTRRAKSIADFLRHGCNREQAMRAAHRIAGFTLTEIAAEAGISAARVGQLVARAEKVK